MTVLTMAEVTKMARTQPMKQFYITPRGPGFALYVKRGSSWHYMESGGTREYLAGYYLKRGWAEVSEPCK